MNISAQESERQLQDVIHELLQGPGSNPEDEVLGEIVMETGGLCSLPHFDHKIVNFEFGNLPSTKDFKNCSILICRGSVYPHMWVSYFQNHYLYSQTEN